MMLYIEVCRPHLSLIEARLTSMLESYLTRRTPKHNAESQGFKYRRSNYEIVKEEFDTHAYCIDGTVNKYV